MNDDTINMLDTGIKTNLAHKFNMHSTHNVNFTSRLNHQQFDFLNGHKQLANNSVRPHNTVVKKEDGQ